MEARIAAHVESVLDALVVEYVDAAPVSGQAPTTDLARRAMHTLGGICALLRCAAGGAGPDDPRVQKAAAEMVEAERARRSLR